MYYGKDYQNFEPTPEEPQPIRGIEFATEEPKEGQRFNVNFKAYYNGEIPEADYPFLVDFVYLFGALRPIYRKDDTEIIVVR